MSWKRNYGRFTLECWGNGLAYALTHNASGLRYFAQGDDADLFERDRDTAEMCWPEKTDDQIMEWLWDALDYGAAAVAGEG
jgi:hypothetical protein